MIIADLFNFSIPNFFVEKEEPEKIYFGRHYVYYLMVGPATVKIGTTRCLPKRIKQLRSELQYVVAIERGGRETEKSRHNQFADERRPGPRREDFMLSDRLKDHINSLLPMREEIMAEATTEPFGEWVERSR